MCSQKKNFHAGIVFGLNGIGLLGESGEFWNAPDEKVGTGHGGITLGVLVKRNFNEKFYSLLEIRYSSKGSIYKYIGLYGTPSYESLYLNYLEFPILIGYSFKPNKRNFYLESGFAYAKLMYCEIEADNLTARPETPTTSGFKDHDFIWIGSLKFPIVRKWEKNFLFGLSISRSILSIHNDLKLYNFVYGIELNYKFN